MSSQTIEQFTSKNNFFREPVVPHRNDCWDYYQIIKHPMDFGTIRNKIKKGDYHHPDEYRIDMNLVFQNAMTYNPVWCSSPLSSV